MQIDLMTMSKSAAPEGKASGADESQLQEIGAQFSGALTQALQQTENQPQPSVVGSPVSKSETEANAAAGSTDALEATLPEASLSEKTEKPFFPLNIISSLQALLGLNPASQVMLPTQPEMTPELSQSIDAEPVQPEGLDVTAVPVEATNPDKSILTTSPVQVALQTSMTMASTDLEDTQAEETQIALPVSGATDAPKTDKADNNSELEVSNPDVNTGISIEALQMTAIAQPVVVPNMLSNSVPIESTASQSQTSVDTISAPRQASSAQAQGLMNQEIAPEPTLNFQQLLDHAAQADTAGIQSDVTATTSGLSEQAMASFTQPSLVEEGAPNVLPELKMTAESKANKAKGTASTTEKASTIPGETSKNPLLSLQDLQSQLDELNGDIELSSPDSLLDNTLPESTELLNTFANALDNAAIGMPVATPQTTTAPSSENTVPAFMSQAAHLADQVVEGTAYSVKNGHQELVIRLNPDNLGEVRVNLSTSGKDGINARLIASSEASHEVLQSHINHLKTSLEAQGVQLERLSVVIAGANETGSSQNNSQQHSQNSQQDSNNQNQNAGQQTFNHQQGQPNPQAAFNMGSQNQNARMNASQWGGDHSAVADAQPTASPASESSRQNDNGKISILA